MSELAAVLRHFIVRDVTYIVGGGITVAATLYWLERLAQPLLAAVPTPFYFLAVGIAYAAGYTISDVGGILLPRWLPAHYLRAPWGLTTWAYRRLTRFRWTPRPDVPDEQLLAIADDLTKEPFGQFHRLVMLRHVGTVIGTCALISVLPLGAVARKTGSKYDWTLTLSAVVFGVLLQLLGSVKAAQQTAYLIRILDSKQPAAAPRTRPASAPAS